VLDVIPENAYELCTGRLFVSVTVITATGLKNMIISEFASNRELLEACLASSTIPYITERNWCRYFRGKPVVDGGLSNNTPVFKDSLRRQLVFTLSVVSILQ
jgi:predicted acylesterase/phospholipase RssA